MKHNLAVKQEEFTYGDYLTWPESEGWQIINGIAYDMSPAPTIDHQLILTTIVNKFYNYLEGKTCLVIPSPVDVVFPDDNQDIKHAKNVVQPDMIIVCDHKKLQSRKRCVGNPDLIVEILSPSTGKLDLKDKLKLYEREGVKEYWIVYPNDKVINVYIMEDNKYKFPEVYTEQDKIKVGIFPELEIDLRVVFRDYIILP